MKHFYTRWKARVAHIIRNAVTFCKQAPNKPVSQLLSVLISVQTGSKVWKSGNKKGVGLPIENWQTRIWKTQYIFEALGESELCPVKTHLVWKYKGRLVCICARVCVCRCRQDLDRCLVSKQAGSLERFRSTEGCRGQLNDCFLEGMYTQFASRGWLAADLRPRLFSAVPWGQWMQLTRPQEREKGKHITCQARTSQLQWFFFFFNILKSIAVFSESYLSKTFSPTYQI